MQMFQTYLKKVPGISKVSGKHGRTVIVSSITAVAVASLLISGGTDRNKSKVLAVHASAVDLGQENGDDDFTGRELQSGLKGIMNSVSSLEEYSLAASSVDITTENEQVLVGTSKVRRGVLNRITLGKGARQAGGVGYYAQRAVRENHMASEDYFSLLQIVEAEATGGDLKSKILIANVVLNRVADSRFPDTIYEVVWDKEGGTAQFSPTADGRIYTVEITDDTYEAVDRALEGEDYSEGALFFMARSSAESHNKEWFDGTLQRLFEYGGHEYYRFSSE
ncbi:MAG: cell wall hydrolase [Blautia sp.]|nr:cell wall hydrolase [Blautia sp.]